MAEHYRPATKPQKNPNFFHFAFGVSKIWPAGRCWVMYYSHQSNLETPRQAWFSRKIINPFSHSLASPSPFFLTCTFLLEPMKVTNQDLLFWNPACFLTGKSFRCLVLLLTSPFSISFPADPNSTDQGSGNRMSLLLEVSPDSRRYLPSRDLFYLSSFKTLALSLAFSPVSWLNSSLLPALDSLYGKTVCLTLYTIRSQSACQLVKVHWRSGSRSIGRVE